jgi:hypothetical protein
MLGGGGVRGGRRRHPAYDVRSFASTHCSALELEMNHPIVNPTTKAAQDLGRAIDSAVTAASAFRRDAARAFAPLLEHHFTMQDTWQLLLQEVEENLTLDRFGRRWPNPSDGWHWIISRPALEDLLSGAAFVGIHTPPEGDMTLWDYPVTLYPSTMAVVYFGQGVV